MKTYVMEHKTTSEDCGPGSVYWQKLTLDGQVSTYLVGSRALGYEPDGVLWDVLRKPGQRPYEVNTRRSEPETPEAYRDRILADIAERPAYYYQRGVVVRLQDEERDAAFDTWQTAEQIRLARNSGRWPRNVDACSQFNRMCDYWPVCSGETTIDDAMRFERVGAHPELEGKHRLPLVTTSSTRSFRSCSRKYFYAYESGVRVRTQAGTLRFGKLIHAGLETWMISKDLDAALATMRTDVYDYEAAKAEAMIRGYHARWCDEPLETLAVEAEFVADLVNPETGAKSRTFELGGKIDAIVRRAA